MAQLMKKRRSSSSNTTKKSSKTGKKDSTKTLTSYGYGGQSQTSARSRYKKARKVSIAPYSSYYEYEVAQNLKEQGIEFEYETRRVEYLYPIRNGLCKSCSGSDVGRRAMYTPDFYLPDYRLWIESKGKWDSKGRTKTLAIITTSGAIRRDNFRMLFQYDNWLTKKHNQTYLDWCEKEGIIAAVGKTIPEEWIK